MQKRKEVKLTDHMESFHVKKTNYNVYETSFRRWLVSQIDSGEMTLHEARARFQLHPVEYRKMIRKWQDRYSEELHLSLSTMSSKDRAENKKLQERIEKLERQLELAKMKNIALETMIDVAETELKLPIRKKSGSKQ